MGKKDSAQPNDYEQKTEKKEDLSEMVENSNVISILKRLQQQMTFLERKVDHLTAMLENKSEREPYHSKFSGKGRRPYHGQAEREFPRGGYSRDADKRPGGYHKAKDSASGSKPFARSFGKPSGKPLGGKKKVFFAKKAKGKYQGERAGRDD